MRNRLPLLAGILLFSLYGFSQEKTGSVQAPTFGIHFILTDFTSAENIRATSLSAALRDRKFGRITNMSPGLALNYIKGLSPSFDFTTLLAGSFLDYPLKEGVSSDEKNLLLEWDFSVRGKMLNNNYWVSPYLQIGTGISKYKGYWGALIPVGAGIQVNVIKELHVLVNAQYRIPVTSQTVSHHFFYSVGVAGFIGKKATPKASPPPPPPVQAALPADRDNDGIIDADDACPDVPGIVLFKGCPDRDEDGIPDKEDNCPQVRGVARYKGCPVPDTDKDGINDEEDKCIEVAGVARYQGCPPPDRDKDGVEDEADKCPDLAGLAANNGCPEIQQAVQKKVAAAAQNIFFATGSHRLLPKSYPALNEVVKLLQEDAALKLDIEGHTDNTGTVAGNQTLSTNRAKSVFDYLVKQGIAASRLASEGFGQDKPVAENTSTKGRAKNRRVEMHLRYGEK